jgi:hypothetical protein
MLIRNVDKFMSRTWRHCRRRRCDDLQSQFISYSLMITKYLMIWDLWTYLWLVQTICDWRPDYCSYNKTNEMHQFLKSIFGIELYIFRRGFLSIIRSLVLYTQQEVYAIKVMLTACCVYSARLLKMDRKPVRNMYSSTPKIDLRNWCISLVLL